MGTPTYLGGIAMSNAQFENLKRHVSRPEMISAIHNYCDRWCERCSFTNRCSVFTSLSQDENSIRRSASGYREDGDAHAQTENERFAELTGQTLAAASDFLRDAAEEAGIDLDEVIDHEVEKALQLKEKADEHPLVSAAREYTFAVHAWLSGLDGPLRARIATTDTMEGTADITEIAGRGMKVIADAVETIMRYQMLITTKLFRAVSHEYDFYDEKPEDTGDADGSAKVALIAIDRSFTSWFRLIDYIPDQERTFLDFLVRLERLRRGAEMAWPNARDFIRPGFDDSVN
jgi:hypothetical protein